MYMCLLLQYFCSLKFSQNYNNLFLTAFKHREQEEAIGWETDHTGQSAPAEGQL